jgi:riboflavin biosynthesis pyrimidine reductase
VVFCSQAASAARRRVFAAEVVPLPEATGGGLDLEALVEELPRLGVWSLLVEGGGRTHERFLAAGLWDRMWMYRNPRLRLAGTRWAAARAWSAIDLAPHRREELRTDLLDVYAHPAALLAP